MGVLVKQTSVLVTGVPTSLPSPSTWTIPEWHREFKLIQSDVVFCRCLPRFPLLGRQALFAAVGAGIHGWAPAAVGAPCEWV